MVFYCGDFPLFCYVFALFVLGDSWFLFNWCIDLLLAMLFGCFDSVGGLWLRLPCFCLLC